VASRLRRTQKGAALNRLATRNDAGDGFDVDLIRQPSGIPPTDWLRAEGLRDAMAAKVGLPEFNLRPYQASAIIRIRNAYESGARRIMLQAATGSGKTRIASTIISGVREADLRALFVAPAVLLIDQTVEKLYRDGIRDIGVLQAAHPMTNPSRSVQVASVQTLQRRELPPADIVFIDEAHNFHDFYRPWMLNPDWADVPFIGLSATPWRKGLGAYYQELIVAATTQDLIDASYLSQFKVFAPAHPDLKGVRIVDGDYHEGDLGLAMDRRPLVADIVETWWKLAAGKQTLCFAVNRAHAQHIHQRFEESGVPAGYIDCETSPGERAEICRKFSSGQYRVVCNVDVLTLGVDWDARCIILARPTKSEMRYVQIIGRGLRTAPGKDHCLILDHSDTTLRLGFVTEIHHPRLDDGKSRERQKINQIKLPKECPQCAYLRPPSTPTCPNCGFTAQPVNKIGHVNGELHELRRDKGRLPIIDHALRRKFYAELMSIAGCRGYKAGWAKHKFKEKFGDWPNGLGQIDPLPASESTLRWVKSQQIRWRKASAVHPKLTRAGRERTIRATSSRPPVGLIDDWQAAYDEEAARLEYEEGLPRPQAELRAHQLIEQRRRSSDAPHNQRRTDMGMDCQGRAPSTPEGEYFQRSVWSWRPLAEYVCQIAPEITAACKCWQTNDGDGLNAEASLRLADALEAEIKSGRTEHFAIIREAYLEQLPNVPCNICAGTGIRKPIPEKGAGNPRNGGFKCNCCEGSGYVRPWDCSCPFNVESVQEFVAFLRGCGGFQIF
jgi:DNA repair protein RadD